MSTVTTTATAIDAAATTTATAAIVALLPNDVVFAVGKKLKALPLEAAIAYGGKAVMAELAESAMQVAFSKAQAGNYRAAALIIGMAAPKAALNFLTPGEGKSWDKASITMLAEKTLERTPAAGKGWNARQLKGRAMAQAILKAQAQARTEA